MVQMHWFVFCNSEFKKFFIRIVLQRYSQSRNRPSTCFFHIYLKTSVSQFYLKEKIFQNSLQFSNFGLKLSRLCRRVGLTDYGKWFRKITAIWYLGDCALICYFYRFNKDFGLSLFF